MKVFRLLLLSISCSLCCICWGMSGDNNNGKTSKLFETAYANYKAGKFDEALDIINRAITIDKGYCNGYILKGDILLKMNDTENAINEYKKAISIDNRQNTKMQGYLGDLLFGMGRYDEALGYYKDSVNINRCNFAIKQLLNPVSFIPINLGENVNTSFDEYFPTFTADDSMMIFTRRVIPNSLPINEDFYVSMKSKSGDEWKMAKDIGFPINTFCNEGTPSISADGNILLFTSCVDLNREEECRRTFGRCDIFFSLLKNGAWSDPVNIGSPINSSSYESQPSLSSDGRTLYFVRAEEDKQGNMNQDIFYSVLSDWGEWSEPIRLNSNINTPGKEASPFIHPDGCTLYFSSDGHQGMGGMDIFISRKDESGEWGEAKNIGYPINTHKDETSLVVSASGKWGYFSSNREGGYGGIDIYRFEMPDELKPIQTTIYKDKTIVLNNILFDLDSFSLKEDSYKELDDIVKLMKENIGLTIEISGHTDSSGGAEYNKELSIKRAESISNYLLKAGVENRRVEYKGYGSSQPVCEDSTEECRSKNRRIEMRLNGVVKVQ